MRSAALLVAVLVAFVAVGGIPRSGGAQGAFGTIRGRVVSDGGNAIPLRRVRVVLAAAGVTSSPAFTDAEGRFAISVPRISTYTLRLTKAGFAPLDVPRPEASDAEIEFRLERGAAVTGSVLDRFGDPLSVPVRVRRVADVSGRGVTATEWVTDSDDLGWFRAGSLPAGRYDVSVEALNQPLAAAASGLAGRPVAVQLRAGEEATLSLLYEGPPSNPRGRVIGASRTPVVENGGIIRGRVVASDGRPVGGVFIALTMGGEGARETTSDTEGRYEFPGLPPGTYRMSAAKAGSALTMRDRSRDVVVTARRAVDTDISMQRPSAVTGTVVDEYGDPVEGMMVELLRPVKGILQQAARLPRRTDDRGRFRIPGAAPGDYYVAAGEEPRGSRASPDTNYQGSMRMYYPGTAAIADALTVPVVAGQDSVGITIGYVPAAGARIAGHAFDSTGQPLTFPVRLRESARSGRPVVATREARVGNDGAFAFLNVPPGDYVVQGVLRPVPGRLPEVGVEFVTAGGSDAPPVAIRTSSGSTVRGRIVLDGDASTVTFDAFGVGLDATDLDYAVGGLDSPGSGVAEDGTFEMRAQGPMRVTQRAAPRGWWLESATIGGIDASQQPYMFPAQGSAPVDLVVVFSDRAGEISGRVADTRGDTPRDAFVLVFHTDSARWYNSSPYVRLVRLGGPLGDPRGAAGGAYRVQPVPPGDYFIIAVEEFDVATEWQDANVLRALARLAERITISERESAVRHLRVVRR